MMNHLYIDKKVKTGHISGAVLIMLLVILLPWPSVALMGQADGLSNGMGIESKKDSTITVAADTFYRVDVNNQISLHLISKTVEQSLREIAKKSGLRLTYVGRIESDKQVTLVNANISVSDALAFILDGTSYEPKFSSNGYLLIAPRSGDQNINLEATQTDARQGYGSVIGVVLDASTGESLPGANVIVKGTSIGVATDVDGRFILRRVPAGYQVLEVRYMGFITKEIPLSVTEEESLTQDIVLESDWIEGDEIFVMARQRGQARALTRQRESVNIRSIVSSEAIDRFGDQTVSSALSRITGMGHGGTNIRGVGSAASNVTMDGQRMGSTGGASRSVDLSTFSTDMVQDLEVIKVITPDMDADALSGVININTRRPIGGERSVNARLGGGWTSRFGQHMGPSQRASFSYGDSPSDDYSYGVNFSYLKTTSASEQFEMRWGTRNFTFIEGPSDVLSRFETELRMNPQERYGAGAQFTFQPTDRATYHIRGMYNYQDDERMTYIKRFSPKIERYTSPTRQGPMSGNQSGMDYYTSLREAGTHQITLQAGTRYLFDNFDMEASLGWGHGRYNEDRYDFQFGIGNRFDYWIDVEDRWHPVLGVAGSSEIPGFPPIERYELRGSPGYRWDSHTDNEIKGSVDFKVPHGYGSIKFGSSMLMTFKRGDHERLTGNLDMKLRLTDFDMNPNANWKIMDREEQNYLIPFLVDMHKLRDFYHAQRPHFNLRLEEWAINSESSNYSADEHVFAGYGMTELAFGSLIFLGGARVEQTLTRYSGKEITINSEGRLEGVANRMVTNAYLTLFPNAQFIYKLGDMTNLRIAYSRSIGRPSYSQLSPTMERNYDSETIREGNPKLNPMVSDNVDFLFEHYFMNVGLIAAGLFYKELSDFVFSRSEILGRGNSQIEFDEDRDDHAEYSGWRYTTFLNGEEARVYGIEFSYQQSLTFLPGFLSNFGMYGNYSYAASDADIGRRNTDGDVVWTSMQGQRPHVVNVGLDYSQGGFSGQVSWQWGAPSISSYGDLEHVPADRNVPLHERRYFDQFRDSANNVSLTMRYRVTANFRLWADGSNILNNRRVDYYYDRDLYPYQSSTSGRSFNFGIRYNF